MWHQQVEKSSGKPQDSKGVGFRLAWYIYRDNSTSSAINSSSIIVLDPVVTSAPKLLNIKLRQLVDQTHSARVIGHSEEEIFQKMFTEKEKRETCSETFSTLHLRLNSTNKRGAISKHDIEIGLMANAILSFCPKKESKIGQFMEQLVKNATPRSLLLIVVNSLQSENLNRNDQTMLNMLYKELDRRLDLKFGRILLALSTQAELKAMLDKELPFFTEYKA